MGGIVGACVCPHPPIMVPEIGGSEVSKVQATIRSMNEVRERLEKAAPECLVVISPHSPFDYGSFVINFSQRLQGDFLGFGAPQVRLEYEGDADLAQRIEDKCKDFSVPTTRLSPGKNGVYRGLDHGVLVPLYFLTKNLKPRLISLSISDLNPVFHVKFGKAVRAACEELGRECFFVASGDLSHRLLPGAPAGYDPRGKEFDRAIVSIFEKGDLDALFDLSEDLVDRAGECGLRSFYALRGCLDGLEYNTKVLSYEGPFGVGYMVAYVEVRGEQV